MALDSYSGLQEAALSVVGREGDSSLTAYAPTAISLVEAKLNRHLRVAEMEATSTGTSDNGMLALPTDYTGWRRVEAFPYGPLEFQEPNFLASRFPNGEGGVPKYFTIQGAALITYPAYAGEIALDYYQKIPALSDINTSNWLLSKHPDVYLFLTVSELYAFAKNYEEAVTWNQRGMTAVEEVNTLDKSKRYSRISVRVKGPTP
ncbi:phage adaptor protein [Microvirga lotononidis]|uniref:Uncharacterized protein n=1 Tax=Microvirga lotononidis TaxID=864069 RepID=I4YP57_9HYPH|nr:hypothetical protein [Microvirga lotononidis]EIM25749.1 hypothetical protein MicloDRAFT_00064760 [Microvirga lotononidis]WQO25678.1 hypothetical protein U0023_13220 [Microvirga lotononidis]